MLKNFLLVKNFDRHVLAGLRIPSKLDLGEVTLAKGSTQLVFSHAGSTTIARTQRLRPPSAAVHLR